jgi:hypothetical protein
MWAPRGQGTERKIMFVHVPDNCRWIGCHRDDDGQPKARLPVDSEVILGGTEQSRRFVRLCELHDI